jgi:hypothetical protein
VKYLELSQRPKSLFCLRICQKLALLVAFTLTLLCHPQAFPETLNCDESVNPIGADDSPNRSYFAELLKRGKDASLEDFMKLWYPDKKEREDLDPGLEFCPNAETTACAYAVTTDTVYSWGPASKVKALEKNLVDNGDWDVDPNPGHLLDSIFTAVGSYAYGPVPVRFKIDPVQKSVFRLRIDHLLLGGKTIESWSYGTPEHYDEIVRDYLRFKSDKPWIGYVGNGHELFWDGGQDGHPVTQDNLKASMLEMVRMILNHEGRIYFAGGQCRNRALHFKTVFPTYINPF